MNSSPRKSKNQKIHKSSKLMKLFRQKRFMKAHCMTTPRYLMEKISKHAESNKIPQECHSKETVILHRRQQKSAVADVAAKVPLHPEYYLTQEALHYCHQYPTNQRLSV